MLGKGQPYSPPSSIPMMAASFLSLISAGCYISSCLFCSASSFCVTLRSALAGCVPLLSTSSVALVETSSVRTLHHTILGSVWHEHSELALECLVVYSGTQPAKSMLQVHLQRIAGWSRETYYTRLLCVSEMVMFSLGIPSSKLQLVQEILNTKLSHY